MALRDLDPDEHLRDPARKQAYVSAVFDTVAPSYDRFTRRFSFGMDARWKRQLAAWVADIVRPEDVVADLACGTGDMLLAVHRGIARSRDRARGEPAGVRLFGVDSSAGMLRGARERLTGFRPSPRCAALLRADLLALPLADGAVAAATVAYGFRNVPEAGAALAEVARVVRPGGWLFDLDFFLPVSPAWRRVFRWYLRGAGRAVGAWWHRDPEAYGYIARSLDRWVTPPAFRSLLARSGFRVERVRPYLGGGICLHGAVRVV